MLYKICTKLYKKNKYQIIELIRVEDQENPANILMTIATVCIIIIITDIQTKSAILVYFVFLWQFGMLPCTGEIFL